MDTKICPIKLGTTYKGTDSNGNLINTELEGLLFDIAATDESVSQIRGGKKRLTGRQLKVRIVRNTSAVALLGKRLVRAERSGYEWLQRVDGYSTTTGEANVLGVVDPYLDSSGCAVNDLCLLIVDGPTLCLTPDTGTGMINIAAGGMLYAATAAASNVSAAGRVRGVTLAGQTAATDAFNAGVNRIGMALSAKTTAETAEDILVHMMITR